MWRCECCNEPIRCDDSVLDFLLNEFPGRKICPKCFGRIELAAAIAKEATLRGIPEAQVAREGYQRYSDP